MIIQVIDEKQERYQKMMRTFESLNLIDLSLNGSQSVISTFTKEDLKSHLKNIATPNNQKKLREISRALYLTSPQYRSLINFDSTLYNFDYVIEGYDILDYSKIDKEKYKKSYNRSLSLIDKMNIKHESIKIRINANIDGVFYGYARDSKDGFYIQQFNPDFCRISHINYETGLFGYSFDFSIFNRDQKLLENYPEEFTTIFNQLKNSKSNNYWMKINSMEAICIKTSPDIYPVPPRVGLFEGILDIADFKALNKGNEEVGTYKLLAQKIPMETKGSDPDHFLISEDWVQIFHNNIEANLPPQVGLITSPMDINAINFEKDSVDKNKVGEATSQYWNESGVSELLFGNNTTSAALKYSIMGVETTHVALVRDIERWFNEYYKSISKGTYKFKIRILETTKFNSKDYFDMRLRAAQFGLPVKNELIAILGMQPTTMEANILLENEILELTDKLQPLKSSHTVGLSDDQGGAPKKDEGDLTDDGLKSKENDVNSK